MKSFYILIFFIIIGATAFSQFTDNFADGDFTSSPIWNGDSVDFQVTANELQLNAPTVSSQKYLSTASQSINGAIWEFKVRMTFNPSSSNYANVYLVSNTTNLSGNVNGYFVRIGNSSDEISLYSQSGSTQTEIIDGRDGVVNSSSVDVKIRVTRSATGAWQLFSDTSSTSTFISEGTITDNTHVQSLFFGVDCNFTSTRSDKFYFDDFVVTGTPFVDVTNPVLDSVNVVSNTQLELVFDEPVELATAQTLTNYSVNNGIGNPTSASRNSSDFSRVNLTFSSPFTLGTTYSLSTNNVTDIAGNSMSATIKNFTYIVPSVPNYRDVVINEIFADPSPMIGLPDGEFIEIYNASSAKYFDLKDWQITDGSSTSTLPSYTLAPDSYVILYSTSTSGDFSIYTKKIAVSSFPSLNNAGDVIELLDDNGNQIDLVEYDNSMYQDAIKDDGGWTLEQINPQANCYNPANWIASNNSNGGTPTQLNSVNDLSPDLESPQLISALAITNSTIEIEISKPIDTAQLFRNLTLSAGRSVMSYTLLDSFGTKFSLSVSPALDTGVVYFLSVDSLTDCEGNFSQTSSEIVLADRNVAGSVILNEILFNPYTGDEDFVELYNNSDLYIDLFGWSLGNDDNGSAGNFKTIDQHYLLKPKEYVFVTKNKVAIIARYSTNSPEKSIEIETLPTYSNESGTVYILTPSGTESDKFDYDEDMHFSLLRNVDGVSLERLNFDRPTQDKTNWHSAAEEVGFATPGVQNSQFTPVASSTSTLSVSPELFSPDNDGFEDILSINYIMTEPGFVGNVSIYDSRGRIIKSLIKNQLLAKKGSFAWDGTNENGTKARIGRYVILFEFYDLDGNVKTEKTTCVVAHKL